MAAQGVFLGVKVHLIDSKSEPDVSSDCCTHRKLNTTLPEPAASIFGPEIDLKFTILGIKVYLIDSKSESDVLSDCCTHLNLNTTFNKFLTILQLTDLGNPQNLFITFC